MRRPAAAAGAAPRRRPAAASGAEAPAKRPRRAPARGAVAAAKAASSAAPAKRPHRAPASGAVAAANARGQAAGHEAVREAKRRGRALINNGAGTMPTGASAPFGGTRYTILTNPRGAGCTRVRPHRGQRTADGQLDFRDAPDFRPNLTPAQCIQAGIFGGCYFNPRGGKPGIFGREVDVDHREFPKDWFAGLPEDHYLSRRYNVATNRYGVKSGQNQAFWEAKGWIHEQDRRGWFQWYCRFYQGRRSPDDARQIERWAACAGERGRWRNQLCSRVRKEGGGPQDPRVAPVIRQTLLHWAYELSARDYSAWLARN